MTTVEELLSRKKIGQVYCINPRSSVFEALQVMAKNKIGALVVTDNFGHIVGMFSERDYARKLILKNRTSLKTAVAEVMTTKVYYIEPNDTIEECMELMNRKKIRHLPVLNDSMLIGIISIGDVVKQTIGNQEFLIDQMYRYITSSYVGLIYPGQKSLKMRLLKIDQNTQSQADLNVLSA